MKRIIILFCAIPSVGKLFSKKLNESFQLLPHPRSIEIILSKSISYQELSYIQIQNEIPIIGNLLDKLIRGPQTESSTDK